MVSKKAKKATTKKRNLHRTARPTRWTVAAIVAQVASLTRRLTVLEEVVASRAPQS